MELYTACQHGDKGKVENFLVKELSKKGGIREKLEWLTWKDSKLSGFYWTSFHYACWNGNIEICKLLIEANQKLLEEADKETSISFDDKQYFKEKKNLLKMKSGEKSDGDTPLHFACWNGHLNLCKYLVEEHSADIHCTSENGDSLLHNACINGREEICRFLLSKAVKLNEKDNNGNTPLHLACWYNQYNICKLLLTSTEKADITCQNKDGDTALHIATKTNRIKICRLLLKHMEENKLLAYISQENHNKEIPSLIELGIKNKTFCKYLCEHRYITTGFNATEQSIENFKKLLEMNDKLTFEFCADHDFPYLEADIDGKAEPNHLYQYFWTEIIDVKSNVKPNDYTEIDLQTYVRKKLEKYRPEIVSRLANIKDKDGRIALNIASENIKNIFYEYMYFCGQYELLDTDFPVYKSATAKVLFALDHRLPDLFDKIFYENVKNSINKTLTPINFLKCLSDLSKESLFVFDKEISNNGITIYSPEFLEICRKCCNTNNSNHEISFEEFKEFCITTFGLTRKVALKFMKNKDQYIREIKARKELDSRFVVSVIPSPDQEKVVDPAIEKFFGIDSPYKYVLIMPAADRSLDAIIRQEKPDPHYVKLILKNVAEAIDHLHTRSIMHGDIKALNVVRVNKKFLLIDMDACINLTEKDAFAGSKFSSGILPPEMFAKIDRKPFKNEGFCLTNERLNSRNPDFIKKKELAISYVEYHKYWFDTTRDEKEEVWKKVTPKIQLGENYAYVIRCYDVIIGKQIAIPTATTSLEEKMQTIEPDDDNNNDDELSIRDFDSLKKIYGPLHIDCSDEDNADTNLDAGLIPASKATDIWSYGILFYWLTSMNKDMLLTCNVDSDFEKDQEYKHFRTTFEWNNPNLDEKIARNIEDADAANLLSNILRRQPKERFTIHQILQHPYFTAPENSRSKYDDKLDKILKNQEKHTELLEKIDKQVDAINKCTRRISDMQDTILNQICKTERILMRSVFEANEVTIPTCFIILNYQIIFQPTKKEEAEMIVKAGKYFDILDQVRETVSSLVVADDQGQLQSKAIDYVKSSVSGALSNWFGGEKEQTFYFYLVDECTFEPVDGPGYPILIKKPAEFVGKVLPLLQVGFKAARLLNGAASLARLIGYPVPVIPQEYMDKAGQFVNSLNNESSVAEYSALQDALDETTTAADDIVAITDGSFDAEKIQDRAKTVRGGALRELKRFLAENDINNTFCNLIRVCSPEGFACWTTDKNHNEMKKPNSKLFKKNIEDNNVHTTGENEQKIDKSNNKENHDYQGIKKNSVVINPSSSGGMKNESSSSRNRPVQNHKDIDHIPLMDEDLKDIIKSQYKMFETQTKILEKITEKNARTQESSQTCIIQ